MFRAHKENSRGLNLVELMIAIVITVFIAMSLMSIFAQGYRNLRKARMRQAAYFLAQEKIEMLSDGDYVASELAAGHSLNESKAYLSAPFADFQREVSVINPDPSTGDSNLSLVNVTVYWNGTQGEQNFSLSTLVF